MDSQSNEAIDQALHIAQAIIGNGGGINVIAPNMQLHVNVQNVPLEGSKSISVPSVNSCV